MTEDGPPLLPEDDFVKYTQAATSHVDVWKKRRVGMKWF